MGVELSPEVLWYLDSRGIAAPEPWQYPLVRTPEPRDVEGAFFDPERVDHVLKVFETLRHTQGALAGQPLRPDPWQIAFIIAPVFGWVKEEDGSIVRIIRELWVEVPRKNGKTTLSGGVAVYLTAADHEPGAQVIAAATTKDQAGFCYKPVASLIDSTPVLRKNFRAYRSANKLVHGKSGSYFQAISAVADAQHGANINGAIIDEVHLHKTPDLVEAIETGTGSRRQPLVVYITTADEGNPHTVYTRKRARVEQLASGSLHDETVYGCIWAAALSEADMVEKGIDPFSEEALRSANPGFGVSPSKSYLMGKAKKAKDTPAEYASYLRLHLGIRTKQTTRFIPLHEWDDSAGEIDVQALQGRVCYGGLDMSSVSDISALCWTFPRQDGEGQQNVSYDTIWRFWLPEAQLFNLNKRTAGEGNVWVEQGFLRLTPGEVIDEREIYEQIDRDCMRFNVLSLGYDRWGTSGIRPRLEENGLQCVGVGQGYATMSGPLKEILRLVRQGRYRHGGNPVMRWMIDNLAVTTDAAGNVKPDKGIWTQTPVLTADGWKTMGDLRVGDRVHTADGSLARVSGVSDTHLRDCYRITLSDGRSVVCDNVHLWQVNYGKVVKRKGEKPRRIVVSEALSADRIAENPFIGKRRQPKYSITNAKPLDRPEVFLPIDPYLLGCWLGDGDLQASGHGQAGIASADPEILAAFDAEGYSTRPSGRYNYRIAGCPCCTSTLWFSAGLTKARPGHGFASELRGLGLASGSKFVPEPYLLGSEKQRMALLQGLLDTDGSVEVTKRTGGARVVFANTNRALADAVVFLARSLGWKPKLAVGRAKLNGRDYGEVYRVTWTAYRDEVPFRLARKASLLRDRSELTRTSSAAAATIVSIERVPSVPTVCITVDHPSHVYLVGDGLIPTHNSNAADKIDGVSAAAMAMSEALAHEGPSDQLVW